MDLAYDHIQEEAYPGGANEQQSSLNDDLQEAYRAFSASPWGARIGGFLGNVVKQGGTVYNEAQQEFTSLGQDASKGLSGLRDSLISHTRSLSLNTATPGTSKEEGDNAEDKDGQTTPTTIKSPKSQEHEATVLEKLRVEAAKRLKDIQRAEDAADEALLNFGISVRDFFREAISIAPPSESAAQAPGTMLFESKDAQGKRVIHASRYDAQLHVVHTSTESFKKDPAGEEYQAWAKDFDVDKKTDDISSDLTAYPELRATMEKVVPDQVSYADFWKRYYFLRHGIETAEARRRDLLKAASAEDDVKWDDDSEDESSSSESDDEEDNDETDEEKPAKPVAAKTPNRPVSASSSTTIQPPKAPEATSQTKPAEARKSNDEKSQADSDTSYDMVGAASGVTSQAPNSPKDTKKAGQDSDDSSDEDWE